MTAGFGMFNEHFAFWGTGKVGLVVMWKKVEELVVLGFKIVAVTVAAENQS